MSRVEMIVLAGRLRDVRERITQATRSAHRLQCDDDVDAFVVLLEDVCDVVIDARAVVVDLIGGGAVAP